MALADEQGSGYWSLGLWSLGYWTAGMWSGPQAALADSRSRTVSTTAVDIQSIMLLADWPPSDIGENVLTVGSP